jgi:hypothetical protein
MHLGRQRGPRAAGKHVRRTKRQRAGRRTAVLAATALIAGVVAPVVSSPVAEAADNAIVAENKLPGTTGWQFDENASGTILKAENHEIEGYASATSVNQGEQIGLMVSLSSASQYKLEIYRMGYYPTGTNKDGTACVGPCGGRLMQTVTGLAGVKQAACPASTATATFGLVECSWSTSYTLTVPSTWTTGNYIVKLTRTDTGRQSYVTFVVRSDAGPADIVLSMDVTTWQAYNFWGGSGNGNIGYNLYGKFNDVTYDGLSAQRASAVSFNRPYLVQGSTDGAGNFMVWDYPLVRWLEANGYNVTYATDLDIENNPGLLNGRKAFTNTGHDEYYSDNMRANLLGYINGGAHMAFLSANNFYFRIRFASSAAGQPKRTIFCYKDASLDPQTPPTLRWRDLTPTLPENMVGGVVLNGTANSRQFRVTNASHWIYAGTGLVNYVSGTPVTSGTGQNAINGLIGYEFDERAVNDPSLALWASYEPAGLVQLAHSAIPAGDNGVAAFSDATLYTAGSGALVFSAGTMQWSWGLDDGVNTGYCDCNPGFTSTKLRQITANIFNKFLTTTTSPAAVTLAPTTVAFPSQALGTTSAAQPVTLTNSGGAPLAISSISVSGTNAGDFAQTNACPLAPTTLASGASCTVNLTFTPASSGSRAASLTVVDNAAGSPRTVALSGTGASAPAVSLSPSSLSYANEQIGTSSSGQLVTISNTGSAPLSIASIGITGAAAADFGTTNTCALSPATLPAGGSCTASVIFTPVAAGLRTAALTVTDSAFDSPQSITVSGTGTTTPVPAVGLSPTTLSFPSQVVATTSSPLPVTLTNTGNAPLTLTSISMTGTQAADFTPTSSCPLAPTTLAAGASCAINTTFRPSAGGTRSATLSVVDDASGSPHTVAVTGTGALAGVYLADAFETTALTGWTVAASTGGAATTQTTVVNSGTRAAQLANASSGQYTGISADLSGGAHAQTYSRFCFYLSGLSGSAILAQGRDSAGNAMWEIDYDNGSKGLDIYVWSGTRVRTNLTTANNLVIANKWYCAEIQLNEATSGRAEVWLNGISVASANANLAATNAYSRLYLWNNGPAGRVYMDDAQVASGLNGPVGAGAGPLPGPNVSLSPSSVVFAGQPLATVSGAQTVTLTNAGTAPLTISSISVGGTNGSDFAQTNTCPLAPSTLAANGSCAISLTFTPSAQGARSATLSIVDNAPGTPHALSVSGTGTPPLTAVVSLSPSAVTFSPQAVNSTSGAQTITLTNTGTAALTLTSIGVTGAAAGEYAQTNTCALAPATILAGAACTISVTFSPLSSGTRSAALTIVDNAPGSPHSATLSGSGTLPVGTYFLDGFENGLALWTSTGNGAAAVQATTVNSGTRALSLTNSSPGRHIAMTANLSGGGQTSTFTRFCFYLSSVTASTTIAQGRDGTGTTIWQMDYDAGSKGLDIYVWNGARTRFDLATANNLIAGSKWYCTELQLDQLAAGKAQVWLNGTSVAATNANLSVTSAYSRLLLWNDGSIGTVIHDDVAVTAAANGPVGAGAAPLPGPAVTLTPASLTFATQNISTTSPTQAVLLRNSGTAPLTVSGVAITGVQAADFTQTNTCPTGAATLDPNATCTINVAFRPTAAGARAATLSITDNAPGGPHTATLGGTGFQPVAPNVSLSPASLTFAAQGITTTSAAQTITLTNSGTAPLTVSGVSVTGAQSSDFAQTNTCPPATATLAPAGTCTISVTFTPTGAGARSAGVSISDSAPGSPHTAALSGVGSLPAGVLLNDGFESGIASWTAMGNAAPASSTITPNSGLRSADLTTVPGQYVGIYADLAGGGQANTFTRFCFRLSNAAASTIIAQGRDATGQTTWEIYYDAGLKGLDTYYWNGARARTNITSPANVIVANTWYCAEMQFNQAVNGHLELWLSGTSVGSSNGDFSAPTYSRLFLWNQASSGTFLFDDAAVSTSYSGPIGAGVGT